jgi:hypothetical protein
MGLNTYMKYYKYLDLDYSITAAKIKTFLEARPEFVAPGRGAWVEAPKEIVKEVPELFTMFKPLGLDVRIVGFFIMHYKIGTIHTDDTSNPIRINFPILNCENTETRYFKTKGPSMSQKQPNGNGFTQFHPDYCEVIDSFKLTQAVAMRVLEPHQVVVNHDNLPRISCTVGFKQDLSYLLD